MQKQINNTGTYLLRYYLAAPIFLGSIKRYADTGLPAGCYYYSGSAQKGLRQRICRHLRLNKKVHWHIDHITTNLAFEFTDAFVFPEAPGSFECDIVKTLEEKFRLEYPLPGFGNSDCTSCNSHLLFTESNIDYNHLCSLYHSTVRLIPSSRETFCL